MAKAAKPKKKKAKPTVKAKAKPKAKAKAKPAAKAKAKAKPAKAKAKPAPKRATSKPVTGPANGAPSIAPFSLSETSPGTFSLLLTTFEPAGAVFQAAGLEGGGYAWEGIARYVTEVVVPEIASRVGMDPESSMFCAYGEDRAALELLGTHMARLFNDQVALSAVIQAVGRDGFDD
ncbi:MAG: Imm51 family immunity protein [Kofleriaceae bacterium]